MVFVIIFGLSYLFIVNSQPFRDYLKPIIVKQLENNLGKTVTIEKIQSVSFNSLVFSNLIILEETEAGENISLLEAERVEINFQVTLPFPHFKNWQLEISQLTLQKANLYLQRDIYGNINIAKNINLQPEMISSNITFDKVYFKDSHILFQDDFVHQVERFSTRIKNLNGVFNLNKLPKIEFKFNGSIEEDNSPIAMQGYAFINKPLYSLNCQLKNVDIMHFQHYIDGFDVLNMEEGRFDLKLDLNSSSDIEPSKIFWQGEISFLGVNLKPEPLNGLFLENVDGLIQFKESEIQISTLQGFLYDQPFHLDGKVSFQEIANVDLDLKANDFSLIVLRKELEEYIPEANLLLEGGINLKVNLKGNFNDFQVKGDIDSSLLNLDDWQFKNINLLFSFKEEQLIIESLETQWEDAKLTMKGIIDWEKPSPVYKLLTEIKGLDLKNPALKELSFLESFSGSVSGNFLLEGTLLENSPINLTSQLTAQEVNFLKNELKEPITAQLEMKIINSSSFELNKFALSYLHNQFNIYGKLDSKNQLDFQFNSDYISLEDLSFLFKLNELKGICNISGKIQGTISQPQIESRLEIKNMNLENLAVDDFVGEISYQQPILQLKKISLNNDNINLSASGQIDLQKNSQKQVNIELTLTRLNMNYLTELFAFEESLSGWTHGITNIQGNWPSIALDCQLDLEEISIRNYYLGKGSFIFGLAPEKISPENISLADQGDFLGWIKNNYHLTIKELNFKQAEMEINTQGKIILKKDFPFSMDIEFIHDNLNNLIEFIDFKDLGIQNIIPTKIEGKLKILGSLISQQFLLDSRFSTLRDEIDFQHDLKLILEKKESEITFRELLLRQKEGEFTAKGWLNLAENLLDIEFQATEFDLNNLAQLIEFEEEIKGNLNFVGTYQGSLKRPSIDISLQIEDGYFRNYKFKDLQSKIKWKEGNLEMQDLTIIDQNDFQIKAQGKIPFPFIVSEGSKQQAQGFNQLPLNFKIILENTDLSFIQTFWNSDIKQIQGITNLILKLSGTVGQPIFDGQLTLNQGSLELTSVPIKLDKIETKIEIVNNLVKISQMTLMLENNLIYISGDFKLVNFQPDNLRIKIWNEGGELIYGDILTAQTTFMAEINGSIDFPQIKGEFIFSEGKLNWKPGYQFIPEKKDSLTSLKGKVDLSAKILNNFQFTAPDIDLKLDGELKIQGDLSQPTFTGQLSAGKGYFVFLEHKFQFSEGKLLLNEFTGPDALLDIQANTKVNQVTVFLKISGNLSAPKVSLTSKPALSEPEIISLLTLNKNIIGLSEGKLDELLREEIFNLIFQGLSINFLRRAENQIADYLGLDVFRIETIFKENSETTPFYDLNFKTFGIEVGKNITEDLFLTYSTSLDGFSERSFSIDYQFKPDLSFTAEINTFALEENNSEIKMGLQFEF